MIVFSIPDIEIQANKGNIFPLYKYKQLRERILLEGILNTSRIRTSSAISMDLVRLAHAPDYCRELEDGTLSLLSQRRIGFPLTKELVLRARHSAGATLEAARAALADSISGGLAGGTHHAHGDFGFGFCVFNDLAVTALTLLKEGSVNRVAVVDLDYHPGDGTAAICKNNPSIYTLSIHGKSILARGPIGSTIDVELSWGTNDEEYLGVVEKNLEGVGAFNPDLVLYQAGVDVLAGDRLGKFALTLDGTARRDKLVFQYCYDRNIPAAFVIGGGYNQDPEMLVGAHAGTVRMAKQVVEG